MPTTDPANRPPARPTSRPARPAHPPARRPVHRVRAGAPTAGNHGAAPVPIGPLLAGLRARRGWSQPYLAARLCAAAGVPTVSRHEVSRWERQRRVPGLFWLRWLAVVLDTPLEQLAAARFASPPAGNEPGARGRGERRAATVGA